MNSTTDIGQPKPHLALAIATGLGLGYVPKVPGTFGSLLGSFLTLVTVALLPGLRAGDALAMQAPTVPSLSFFLFDSALAVVIGLVGVWAGGRVALYLQDKDPQVVVIDEVSGQLITYLGLAVTSASFALNWKYLLAGFILFRVFDIWKPFPARLAESFPGGIGIMADDWVAGVYAALALALARQLGL
jgi:phosphatidylglycerophosphatase A